MFARLLDSALVVSYLKMVMLVLNVEIFRSMSTHLSCSSYPRDVLDVVDMLKSGLNEDEYTELFTLSKTKY